MVNDATVCAVVVTYNRKEYLLKTIDALAMQTYPVQGIFVFDNFSSDGTVDTLIEKCMIDRMETGTIVSGNVRNVPLFYYRNDVNSGGSGGFHDAMKMASQMNFDYLWTMDDDVLPEPDCLEKLLRFADADAEICIPNRSDGRFRDHIVTAIDMKNPLKYSIGARKTYHSVSSIVGDYACVCDMPFEGPLISISLIKKIGLPKKDLFIIFDDTE